MTETTRTPREQFRKDSADFLSAMNSALLTLEKNPTDMEIVNEFFRSSIPSNRRRLISV
jgi:chemotaxis protein histidine kinase CheA